MKNIKYNSIQFRGQFADALELLLQGEEVTIHNFRNGKWEPTTKVQRFINLLNEAKIEYINTGDSLRTACIRLKD